MPVSMNLKVFWRILLDVVCGHVLLRKEFTVWDLTSPARSVRLSNGTISLRWEPVGQVYVHNDRVEFREGYLKCYDVPVNIQNWFKDWYIRGGNLSKVNEGENVSVSAEVSLPVPYKLFPIFYYPQNSTGLYLALWVEDMHPEVNSSQTNQSIFWKIEREGCKNSNVYHIAGRDGWHRVRVRQDQDWTKDLTGQTINYFEFFVDSIPRGGNNLVTSTGDFEFEATDKVFYIGRIPDPAHSCNSDPSWLPDPDNPADWRILNGDLRHLVFDPNDSCTSCNKNI